MRRSGLNRAFAAAGIMIGLVVAGVTLVGVPRVALASGGCLVNDDTDDLNVTGVSFAFTPCEIQVLPLNEKIYVNFTDGDTAGIAHTFTILGCPNYTIANPSTASNGQVISDAYGTGCPHNLINVNASGAGTFPTSGPAVISPVKNVSWYEFLCTEGGHFQQGMYGYLAFGEDLPANLTVSSPYTGAGLAVFIIVGTIVTLTVIALVLGFVVGRRRGSEFEMPPERLGYAEPTAPPASPPPASPPLRPGTPPPSP
jgi:hypothetical protein